MRQGIRLERGWVRAIALAVACAAMLALPAVASASSSYRPAPLGEGGVADDCLGHSSLQEGSANRVRFVVWCSVRTGKVDLKLRRDDGAPIVAFSPRLQPSGAGHGFHCHRAGQTIKCAGRKTGPLTLRGSFVVPPGTRCERVFVDPGYIRYQRAPLGCPGERKSRLKIDWGYFRGFRLDEGLDYELKGDRAALDRRIESAIAGWHRGEPVARVSASMFGMPLTPLEMWRFEVKEELLDRTVDALERWVPSHAADTYAGYMLDTSGPVVIRIGFTGDQAAQLGLFKRQNDLFAPARVQSFLVPPQYSEKQLGKYEEELLELLESGDSPLAGLVTSIGSGPVPARVEIGTQHVAKVKRLLLEMFGTLDPFAVRFEPPGELL
jgi:hypothetical protein